MMNDTIRPIGDIEILTEYSNGTREIFNVQNTVLLTGRRALTSCLAGNIGDSYQFYINRMLFGDGGTQGGVKKYVDAGRDGLFGVTQVSKPVLANIDSYIPTQAIFTSTIKFDEAVGVVLNEMALQMANGNLYSMTTFPDLSKTEDMQITFNWRLNFI
jgi:hypothetical protein